MGITLTASFAFACLSGILLGLTQPFYLHGFVDVTPAQNYLALLAFVGYVPLFWALAQQNNLKRVFAVATAAITVQHTIVLYWIYITLHVHGHVDPVSSSLITLLLPIVLALKGAAFLTVAALLAQRFSISFFWCAPVAITAAEYFRNFYIFGGFPWGTVGTSLGRIEQIAQLASVVGVYGLVFFAAIVNALICLALARRNPRYGLGALALVVLVAIGGQMRLEGADDFAPSVRVALLQGNIPQEVKREARLHSSEIVEIYHNLVREAKRQGAELVVWPESAMPKMLDKDLKELNFAYDLRAASIIGSVVYGDLPDGDYYVQNSGFITDFRGAIINRYDKSHLVPFGEYVPWPMTGIVDKIVPGLGAFRPGTDFVPTKVAIKEGKEILVGTTVCYEGIFPEISRAYARAHADLLVNLTNDAWFGLSSAPYQHMLMYRLRSVESGLPFVRATNAGISAWVDAYGREHQATPLFERKLVIADVPLLTKKTLYAQFGDVIPLLCLLLMIVGYVGAVVPVHRYLRERQWRSIAILLFFSAIATAATMYFQQEIFVVDESARTKSFLISLFALLLMIGCLNQTKRSRTILVVMASVVCFISIALAIFESLYFLLGLVLGLLIYLLAYRIKLSDRPTQ